MNKVLKKGILITLISTITLSCFSACFPTPQKSRNNEVNGIQLQAEVSKDERIPIIRTMTLEDYQSKDEAEKEKRGVYAGAIGYLSVTGDLDFAIAIRTMILKNMKAYVQAGAGIVYDSIAENEYQETVNKAKSMTRIGEEG